MRSIFVLATVVAGATMARAQQYAYFQLTAADFPPNKQVWAAGVTVLTDGVQGTLQEAQAACNQLDNCICTAGDGDYYALWAAGGPQTSYTNQDFNQLSFKYGANLTPNPSGPTCVFGVDTFQRDGFCTPGPGRVNDRTFGAKLLQSARARARRAVRMSQREQAGVAAVQDFNVVRRAGQADEPRPARI